MTLEHIHEPLAFLKTIRRSIGNQFGTKVFFQVPDMRRVLAEIAFWDIYYEHCSYFSLGSLARVFRKASFDVVDITSDYNGQYIMITARVTGAPAQPHVAEGDISSVRREVSHFEQQAAERIAKWRDEFARILGEGRRVVLWGSGSKAVSFLSTVGITKAIDYVVDINPYRQGTYMAGSGQRVISPEFLKQYRPDSVLVMNEIYLEEIQRDLAHLGLNPELKAICGKTLAAA